MKNTDGEWRTNAGSSRRHSATGNVVHGGGLNPRAGYAVVQAAAVVLLLASKNDCRSSVVAWVVFLLSR